MTGVKVHKDLMIVEAGSLDFTLESRGKDAFRSIEFTVELGGMYECFSKTYGVPLEALVQILRLAGYSVDPPSLDIHVRNVIAKVYYENDIKPDVIAKACNRSRRDVVKKLKTLSKQGIQTEHGKYLFYDGTNFKFSVSQPVPVEKEIVEENVTEEKDWEAIGYASGFRDEQYNPPEDLSEEDREAYDKGYSEGCDNS